MNDFKINPDDFKHNNFNNNYFKDDDFQYNDILDYKYPNLEIEKDFPDKILRAAQFAPFSAVSGYDRAVKEASDASD